MSYSTLFDGYKEHEIWESVLFKFQWYYYVKSLAEQRLPSIQSLFDESINAKKSFNSKTKGRKAEVLHPLHSISEEIVLEVNNNTKQARDFYHAAENMPLISNPILLFYAFEKLAKNLILLTYEISGKSTFAHGITYPPNSPVIVKRCGLFQRFHDCYSNDPSIYLNDYSFSIDSLAGTNTEFDAVESMNRHPCQTKVQVPEYEKGKQVEMIELDRQFLLMFAIATLARYRSKDWSDIISGKSGDDLINKISRSINIFKITFPNYAIYSLYDPNFDSKYRKFV